MRGQASGPDCLVRVLGPVSAVVDGEPCTVSSPVQRALLALLATSPGRVVPVDRLISELWAETPPDSAASTVRVYVSRLRRALGDAVDVEDGPGAPALRIRRRAPGYLLELPDGALDAVQLGRLLDAARGRTATDPAAALQMLDEGLALVTGEPLADVVHVLGPVGQAEARRLSELVLTAQEARLQALLALGRPADVVAEVQRLLAAHPLRESLHGLGMLALYRSGRQAEALAAYEAVRRLLLEDLGVDPGTALRRLHAQMLDQDPALEAPAPEAPVGPAGGSSTAAVDGTGMIGRAEALADLLGALHAARAGSGGTWVVSGEAGIGKTRLLQELVRAAVAGGTTVALGRARETVDATPYWLWGQVFRDLPDVPRDTALGVLLGEADSSAALTRAALHDSVARSLVRRAQEGPVLLLLEDVHWADEPSLALLALVAEHAPAVPLLVVCSFRVEDAPPGGHVGALLARLARTPGVGRTTLVGLGDAETRDLLTARLGRPPSAEVASAVRDLTAGNPFFLQEIARLVRESDDPERAWRRVPRTVSDVLLHRVARLPRNARRLLDVASVLGRECDLGLLEDVSGIGGEEVDEGLAAAVQSGLVAEVDGVRPLLRFPHALVRETLYAELGTRSRMRLHAEAGRVLAARPDSDVDDLAWHLLAGGDLVDREVAVAAVVAAAGRAMGQLALEHAQDLLDRSLPLVAQLPASEARERLELAVQTRRGTVLATRLGFAAPEARAALERAQELALQLGTGSDVLPALYRRYLWLLMSGDLPGVFAFAEALVARSSTLEDVAARDRFGMLEHLARGSALWCLGDAVAAVPELSRALELGASSRVGMPVDAFGDPAVRARMFLCHALASCGRTAEAKEVADRMVGEAHQSGPGDASDALATRGMMHVALGEPEHALADGVEGRRLGRLAGAPLLELFAALNEGWGAGQLGGQRADGAVEMVRAAVAGYEATGTHMHDPIVYTMLAETEQAAGESGRAADAAAAGLAALARAGSRLWRDRLEALAGTRTT
ncbi:AfsR/SARP family transcriptional regulator [Motilibacter rhizosphaerae]|nr:AfsR/SARP family transcriptional regulator [Motilibacter rhizosphaerae]